MRFSKAVWRMFPRRCTAIAGVCAGAMVLGAGCGGSSDSDEPSPAEPRVHDLANAVCDLFFRCCARGEMNYILGPHVTRANCAERLVSWSEQSSSAALEQLGPVLENVVGSPIGLSFQNLAALERATSERRGRIDQEGVTRCVLYLEELDCNQPEPEEEPACVPPDPPPEPTPCEPERLFVGQVKAGEACTSPGSSLECEEGLVCRGDDEYGVFGECVQPGLEGDLCFADSECAEDLYCSLLYGTCRPFSQEGEACAFADRNTIFPDPRTQLVRCAEHLFCDYVTDRCVVGCQVGAPCDEIAADPETPQCDEEQELICILGRCDQPRTEGLPCGEDADCVEGLHCSPDPNDASQTELICQPPFDFDRPCSRHAQCLSQFCHPDTLLCTGRVGPDGPCLTGDDAECRDGFCIRLDPNLPCTSVADCYCQALRADGESCSQDRQCASEACVAGACQQLPVPDGERCDEATDCASEYCNLAEAEPTCAELPLGLGAACDPAQAADCESGVCYDAEQTGETVCTEGLEEGQECDPSDPTVVPCDPRRFYCDRWDRQPAVCVPWLETGDLCDTGVACRSQLCEPGGEPQPSSRPGRRMCVPAIPEGAAFCDNED